MESLFSTPTNCTCLPESLVFVSMQLAELKHHGNSGAAAQRILSDITQEYISKYTLELPPEDHVRQRAYTKTNPIGAATLLDSSASIKHEESPGCPENCHLFNTVNGNLSTAAKIVPLEDNPVRRQKARCWKMQRRAETIVFTLENSDDIRPRRVLGTTNTPEGGKCNTSPEYHTFPSLTRESDAVTTCEYPLSVDAWRCTLSSSGRLRHHGTPANAKQMASELTTCHGNFDGW